MTHAPLLGAGVIVPTGDGRVLIGRRTAVGEPPTWSLPGGKVDPGESFERTAARELAEETGIVLPAEGMRVLALLLDHELGRPRLTAAVLAPPSLAVAVVTEPHACGGWERVPLDALPEPMFYPSGLVLGAWNAELGFAPRPGTRAYPVLGRPGAGPHG
ncbi:nucleotide triphosphate diphosphatase NUDT15 [Kitasatospora purpeofusca]|uniref:nucleotide triphosphate diphosphatase NUDT15 n=1 Tax=Kitasatospora purpeofusca TaxID=67352 RepID=UPI002250DB25|nr:NUDIX domain-containing protein [Kitasatospora purpeofusca]MCX4758519.1 NUDIX domain-containing protein [Kitasatospora purpeofusca]WSR31037.1 NUDIX domain-containing protein [Kitasatospora purpeofusca]WSR39071.1 NUDIX domain-containing protein [Kitasatospora purpeofusca]